MEQPDSTAVKQGGLTRRRRVYMVIIAWLLVPMAMVVRGPIVLVYAMYFPLGITAKLIRSGGTLPSDARTTAALVVAWLFYIGLTAFVVLTRRRAVSVALYVILCVILAFNVAGCHAMITDVETHF